jgi:hypothetical protein
MVRSRRAANACVRPLKLVVRSMESGRDLDWALRVSVIAMLMLATAAHFLEDSTVLSAESLKYQVDYPNAIRSGFSLAFGLVRLLVYAGAALGVVGGLLTFFRPPWAFTSIALSAPLIALAAYMDAPQSDYPSVEPITPLILWCLASAVWGASVTMAWMRRTRHHAF